MPIKLKNPFAKPKSKPAPTKKPVYPTGRAGNYAQQVDTTGMDPEMKRTLGIGKKRKAR